jgi:hypothetical protein
LGLLDLSWESEIVYGGFATGPAANTIGGCYELGFANDHVGASEISLAEICQYVAPT